MAVRFRSEAIEKSRSNRIISKASELFSPEIKIISIGLFVQNVYISIGQIFLTYLISFKLNTEKEPCFPCVEAI